jgi:hypothetical protein
LSGVSSTRYVGKPVAPAVLPRVRVAAVAVLPVVASLMLRAILAGAPDNVGRLLLVSRRLVACATRHARKPQAVPVVLAI